ncbi:Coenzyme F420 hydrogenase/dehydrogenase, beta subunit C-terminal domain [Cloacibacillus sp.]|uniref:Coenzyme F420 hydrogenase/dehydrogenase, beta subunit C-terminal domain n=1 Tax=Cloacibacillus sp. TaxID=2049023 RepID=UPI0025C141FC|nr:Coenzyme F420 hydrogenase/dehydrogenase, beta subunit C-terminal domain [Cloacibacillus sp.]MCC8057462.1 Coenzyme F420 hydrogenase/dehydrogenase, beta subunit C-terminal domain [Cloacibacillus sp.]MCC8174237.1 Coenzyme F420 hydrogenase/dehydrogenase, beta subunit C-terminal domain [Odoribacter sp.]
MITLFEKKQDCCGCTACKTICPVSAITMRADKEGFLYPEIDKALCIECGHCNSVCAFQNNGVKENNYQQQIYAMKIKDDKVRKESSSGGAFTAISDVILENDGSVYGAAHDVDLSTMHIRATDANARDRCRGSKYVQSDMRDNFRLIEEDLKAGKEVLFTGTPCQTAGLISYLTFAGCATGNLYTADLICHGVPSPAIFQEFLRYVEHKTKKTIKEYLHRPKDTFGWSHNEKIVYTNGTFDDTSKLALIWKTLFYSNTILRPACITCKYAGIQRYGDITLADFWGIEYSMPEFKDESGVSLIFINSKKGEVLFDQIKDKILYRKSSIENCRPYQQNLQGPSICHINRDDCWKLYHKHGFPAIAKKYGGYNKRTIIKEYIKLFLHKIHLLGIIKKILKRQ